MRLPILLLTAAALGGCGPDHARPRTPGAGQEPEAAVPAPGSPQWRSSPTEGVTLSGGDTLLVETGPHVVLWPEGAAPVAPPYTVRAGMRKLHGRLQEGYGIVFGGRSLGEPETQQRYSYFLVRGDGSYLIKRRIGAETPQVRPWTAHTAVRRDTDEGGRPNELEVRVGEREVAFVVNGAEVARVPAAELDTRGVPGVRAAHGIQLVVTGFAVVAGSPGGGEQ
ncbi:MAG TPA: hypothetical protein VHG28_15465 [Longimicrobiaceae bacterium]|nr:hypothetical protein [Longimicrobiaceae bacterium]